MPQKVNNRIRLISTEPQKLPKNTHRAFVESIDYSKIMIIASGSETHCRQVMDRWLKEHDVIREPFRAYVAEIRYDYIIRTGKSIHPNNVTQTIDERKYK